jgi:hypothetical protein
MYLEKFLLRATLSVRDQIALDYLLKANEEKRAVQAVAC